MGSEGPLGLGPSTSRPSVIVGGRAPHDRVSPAKACGSVEVVLRMRVDRSSIARLVLVIALVALAIVLLWHLFGMVHSEGMGILGGCLFLLVAALVLIVPAVERRVRVSAEARPERPEAAEIDPVCRPPPVEAAIESVVLIC